MKRLFIVFLPLLAACSTQPLAPEAGLPVSLVRLDEQILAVRFDGVLYSGVSGGSPCFTDACRGEFRHVPRRYRRLIRHGEAELNPAEGSSERASRGGNLSCRWLQYRDQSRVSCSPLSPGQGG